MARLFILFLFPIQFLNAQFIDDFSDGDFTTNPEWTGLAEWFRVDPQQEALQLNAPAEPGSAWLFTRSAAMEEAVWQFSFRFGFNPSSANYAEVFLASDSNIPDNIGTAYYLVIGTTADNISLWERRAGRNTRLIEGENKRIDFNIVEASVRVTRKQGGEFILEVKLDNDWIEEGRITSSAGFRSVWFGLVCHYTATRSSLFWFDDFMVTGAPFRDTIPVKVDNFVPLNRYKFEITFNKPVENLRFSTESFVAHTGNKIPNEITPGATAYSLLLNFPTGIPVETESNLKISGITDLYDNVLTDTAIFYQYEPAKITSFIMTSPLRAKLCINKPLEETLPNSATFVWNTSGPGINKIEKEGDNCLLFTFAEELPDGEVLDMHINNLLSFNGDTIDSGPYALLYYLTKRNDIVITEIMSNPSPVVQLPDSEFLELFNRGEFPVELKDCGITVGTRSSKLQSYLLFPGEYVVLVPSTRIQLWAHVTNKISVTSWPLLPVTSGQIILTDKYNRVITSMEYHRNMGDAGFKQDGGWSFEIKDPDNLSFGWDNWNFSKHPDGGTPGAENSVAQNFPDLTQPEITGLFLFSDSCMAIEFSKPMEPDFLISKSNLQITPSQSLAIDTVYQEPLFLKETHICFTEKIPASQEFIGEFHDAPSDLSGNSLQPSQFRFGLPVSAIENDVVINELLYDPPTGGEDFVELYNRSDKIIDLSSLYLARDNSEGIPDRLIRLGTLRRPFFPGEYLAFTSDKEWLTDHYQTPNPFNIREVSNLPNYVNDGGVVFLTTIQGETIDRFDYHPKLHFNLLSSTKGVSLERIHPELPTNDASNWHSASADHGYATAGLKNSQANFESSATNKNRITLEPEIFIPNQNGHDDFLMIHYAFDEPGYSCTVTIFNRAGQPIRHLINNQLAGTSGFYKWDGTNDSGHICPTGIYVVFVRYFNLKGKVFEEKKATVLGVGR